MGIRLGWIQPTFSLRLSHFSSSIPPPIPYGFSPCRLHDSQHSHFWLFFLSCEKKSWLAPNYQSVLVSNLNITPRPISLSDMVQPFDASSSWNMQHALFQVVQTPYSSSRTYSTCLLYCALVVDLRNVMGTMHICTENQYGGRLRKILCFVTRISPVPLS